MNTKLIWTSGASVLVTAILILGGLSLTNDKMYGCEDRGIVMPCDSLSQYYNIPNGKCVNAELGNKLCKTGWTQGYTIQDETIIPEPQVVEKIVEKIVQRTDCPVKVIAYTNTGKYYCEGIGPGQKCTSTTEILSQLG